MNKEQVKTELKKMCRLYERGDSVYDNPYDKTENQFYWYIWMSEMATIQSVDDGDESFESVEDCESYFHLWMDGQIEKYVGYLSDPKPMLKMYYSMPLRNPVE